MHLYEQLKEKLKRDIENKVYKQGDQIPNETELEKQYSVSRITVRRAVKELCDEGLLVKKQGKGTFVAGFNQLKYDGAGFKEVMEGMGKKPDMREIEKSYGNIPLHIAKVLGLDVKRKAIVHKRLMIADGEPISVDTYYLPADMFDGIYDKLDKNVSIIELLTDEYDLDLNNNRKMLGVIRADKELAGYLNCDEDAPVYEFFRIIYNENNEPVLLTVSWIACENKYYILDESKERSETSLVWGS